MTDTMDRIELEGYVNADGKLEVDVPPGFPIGKVRVALEVKKTKNGDVTDEPSTDESWTDEEIREALKSEGEGKTFGEILQSDAIGSWADSWGDRDSAEWVEEQRSKHRPGTQW